MCFGTKWQIYYNTFLAQMFSAMGHKVWAGLGRATVQVGVQVADKDWRWPVTGVRCRAGVLVPARGTWPLQVHAAGIGNI